MPTVSLKQLSAQLHLGDRVVNTGNRPGRFEREKLRSAAAAGRISSRKPWQWDTADPELPIVRQVLQGVALDQDKRALKQKRKQQRSGGNAPQPVALPSPPPLPPLRAFPPPPARACPGSKRPRRSAFHAEGANEDTDDDDDDDDYDDGDDDDDDEEEDDDDEEDEEQDEGEDNGGRAVAAPSSSGRAAAASSRGGRAAAVSSRAKGSSSRTSAPACARSAIPAAADSGLVGTRLEIWREGEMTWDAGTVRGFSRSRGHQVVFDPLPGEDDLTE